MILTHVRGLLSLFFAWQLLQAWIGSSITSFFSTSHFGIDRYWIYSGLNTGGSILSQPLCTGAQLDCKTWTAISPWQTPPEVFITDKSNSPFLCFPNSSQVYMTSITLTLTFFPSPFYMQFSWYTLSSLPRHQPCSSWWQVCSLTIPDYKGNKSRWSILCIIHLHVLGELIQKLLNRTWRICTAVWDVWRPFPPADALIQCTSILTRTKNKT